MPQIYREKDGDNNKVTFGNFTLVTDKGGNLERIEVRADEKHSLQKKYGDKNAEDHESLVFYTEVPTLENKVRFVVKETQGLAHYSVAQSHKKIGNPQDLINDIANSLPDKDSKEAKQFLKELKEATNHTIKTYKIGAPVVSAKDIEEVQEALNHIASIVMPDNGIVNKGQNNTAKNMELV